MAGKEARMASALFGVVAGMLVVGGMLGAVPDAAAEPESPAARCADLAGDLQIEPALQPLVIEMCRSSSTFRRQVARLADADRVTVTVRQVVLPSTSAWRAQAAITRVGSEVQSVDVQVHAGGSRRLVAELIAHEFEHILEQLDGVDLKGWVGRSGVRRVGTGERDSPIATERARRVGRIVANEYMAANAGIAALKVR
jgi:hypothetical protein